MHEPVVHRVSGVRVPRIVGDLKCVAYFMCENTKIIIQDDVATIKMPLAAERTPRKNRRDAIGNRGPEASERAIRGGRGLEVNLAA